MTGCGVPLGGVGGFAGLRCGQGRIFCIGCMPGSARGAAVNESEAAKARVNQRLTGQFREMPCPPEEIPDYLAKERAAREADAAIGESIRLDRRERERLDKLTRCRLHRETYIEYARQRIVDEDWHELGDAANDLRELDVEIRMLEDAK